MEKEFEAYLTGELNENELQRFEKKLADSETLRTEFELFKKLWFALPEMEVPTPSSQLYSGFNKILEEEIKIIGKQKTRWGLFPKVSLAAALLIAGTFLGIFFQKSRNVSPSSEVASLTQEVKELKEMMMLQMIKDPMATERLRAVTISSELPEINESVLDALFVTLNNDENDNVRLVTLETLTQWADRPEVREQLIKSMANQESPIVQLYMAELMIRLQEKRALESVNNLLEKENLNPAVKEQLEIAAQQLKMI
jgi:hypothetical protein